jgi:hypothetical protein
MVPFDGGMGCGSRNTLSQYEFEGYDAHFFLDLDEIFALDPENSEHAMMEPWIHHH